MILQNLPKRTQTSDATLKLTRRLPDTLGLKQDSTAQDSGAAGSPRVNNCQEVLSLWRLLNVIDLRKLSTDQLVGRAISSLATVSVAFPVTVRAERDQILGAVMPKPASPLDVMNLQIFGCAAVLATPIVPGKNLLAKSLVRLSIQSERWSFWPQG